MVKIMVPNPMNKWDDFGGVNFVALALFDKQPNSPALLF